MFKNRSSLGLCVMFFFCPACSIAQEVWQLMAARDFHRMPSSPEKNSLIRALEYDGWFRMDTFLGLNKRMEMHKIDVTPFVDEMGESVFLVTDVSPEFPGGALAQGDYFQNLLSDLLAKPEEVTHNTLFIKFSVSKTGQIEAVEPASSFSEWVPETTTRRCLDAVREMPNWTPGIFKNRPVKVKMMLTFSLRA